MTDPTTPSTTTPSTTQGGTGNLPVARATSPSSPSERTTKRRRSDVRREFLEELKMSRKVATAAADERYAAALAAVDLDAAIPSLIETRAAEVNAKLARLKGARAEKKQMTKQEKTARDALVAVIQPIQTAAKRKFSGDAERLREAYYVGDTLSNDSLDDVLTAARNILARLTAGATGELPQDILPGIKADKQIKALADAIDVYTAKDEAQNEHQGEVSKIMEEVGTIIETLAALRRQIQLAADQAWPWRTQGVMTIRKAFLLPTDRPLTE